MNKAVFVFALLFAVFFGTHSALAYGGGGGFPPGYFDNPHAHRGLTCEWVEKKWPNGTKFNLPWCHVTDTNPAPVTDNTDIRGRINGFFHRLAFGRRFN